MTDFDVLARLRKLEADMFRLRDRIAELERPRRAPDLMDQTMPHCPMPTEYDGHMPEPAPIWPVPEISDHEACGAMVHAMKRKD